MKEKKNFSYMAASAYHVISKEVKNHILRHNWILRHTCCVNNPHWQSDGIITFLCKYYIFISDKLVGSSLDVLFLLLAVMLSGPHEKLWRDKDWVTEKKYLEEFVWGASVFWLTTLYSMSLCVTFFVYSCSLPKWRTWWMVPIKKIHNIAMGDGILCDDIMSERLKIWKSLKSLSI